MYAPPESLRAQCAPTEEDRYWRKRLVQGTVHDEAAAMLDGVAGHAGLFSTAPDLAVVLQMLLDGGTSNGKRYLKPQTIALFTRRQSGESSRALGWDTPSSSGSSAGKYFSPNSFGHTGFTGTSVWIDPVKRIFVVFLTNRVHPTRENKKLLPFRAVLHDEVMRVLLGR
jgi:CubicO group peptidase (beta-lactamase class C family)